MRRLTRIAVWSRMILMVVFLVACVSTVSQSIPSHLTIESLPRDLPPVVRFVHWGNGMEIVWYDQPFSGAYYRLPLKSNGAVEIWHEIVNWASQGGLSGQLAEESRKEVTTILSKLKDRTSDKIPDGSRVIGLFFSWEGINRVLYYSDLTCDDDIRRLLEIVDVTLKLNQDPKSSLIGLCTPEEFPASLLPTPTKDRNRFLPLPQPPDLRKTRMLSISWVQRPMTETYEMMSLLADDSLYYDAHFGEEANSAIESHISITDEQAVRETLASLATLNETPDLTKAEIIVSFPWNGDYHIVGFTKSQCPAKLRTLFDMMLPLIQQSSSDHREIESPCSG